MKKLIASLEEAEAIICDLDGTLVEGNTAEKIGRKILRRELFCFHLGNVRYGLKKRKKINELKENGKEIEGLKQFFEAIGDRRIITRERYRRYARKVIEKNEIKGSKEFLHTLRQDYGLDVFIISVSDEITLSEAKKYFKAKDTKGNPVYYYDNSDLIKGIKTEIKDAETKYNAACQLLQKYGISLKDCVAIGNDKNDLLILSNAAFSLCSPNSKEEIREIVSYPVGDYEEFLKTIKALKLEM